MDNQNEITEEAFAAKEREIGLLFGQVLTDASEGMAPPDSIDSANRIQRILGLAKKEPTPRGEIRIRRIMERVSELSASDSSR